jgi:hypothetical protein
MGDAGVFSLTLVSIAISMMAPLSSELMARHVTRWLDIG